MACSPPAWRFRKLARKDQVKICLCSSSSFSIACFPTQNSSICAWSASMPNVPKNLCPQQHTAVGSMTDCYTAFSLSRQPSLSCRPLLQCHTPLRCKLLLSTCVHIATSPDPLGSTSVVVIGNTKRATKHLRACVWHDQSQRTRFDC